MERRLDARFPAHFEAAVTNLEHPNKAFAGEIADISAAGIRVILPVELAAWSIVKLEAAGSVLFGHVIYCRQAGAEFHTGIEIARVLFGESDLSKLLHAVLIEQMPALVSARL